MNRKQRYSSPRAAEARIAQLGSVSVRLLISIASIAALIIAAWVLVDGNSRIRSLTGGVSHAICSGVFVSGLKAEDVIARTLRPLPGFGRIEGALHYEIDTSRRAVTTASIAGAFASRVVYRDRLGCVLVKQGSDTDEQAPVILGRDEDPSVPILKEIAPPSVVEPTEPRLRAALDEAFAETGQPPHRFTAAVVVVSDSRVVAERYATGYGLETPLPGWSMTKSVINALIGILVRQGQLSLAQPASVAEWRDPGDPRHAITIDHLLRMTSGLAWEEDETKGSLARMLGMENDMAGFAARSELALPPGTKWYYNSGNTLILSRIIRDAVGGHAEDVLRFAKRDLFDPLGMRSVTLEFDGTGTPIGSTYMYASARDWARFGMLYLNDGALNGRRILPEGWVRYSSSQTLHSPYAAGFWLSKGWRSRWNLPEDAFFASGFLGQRLVVIPSKQLVIVRLGNAHTPVWDLDGFGRLVSEVIAAIGPPG